MAVLGTSDGTLRFLKMLRLVRSLRQIRLLEPRPDRAEEVAGRAYRELALPVRVSQDVEDAVQDAELVLVTAGAAGVAPLETVPEGCHVAVVDPALRDAVPAAGLLSTALRKRARVVVDDRRIAREAGWADAEIDAELGEVLSEPPVRTASEVTVHATVGLPFQELLSAWQVFESAREDRSCPAGADAAAIELSARPGAPPAPFRESTAWASAGGDARVHGAAVAGAGPGILVWLKWPHLVVRAVQLRVRLSACPSPPFEP